MPVHRFADMTWEQVRDAGRGGAVAILPVGAVEAHGPHLPLGTDVLIAEGMARSCAEKIDLAGGTAFVLPPIWYTAAPFAEGFPGTLSVHADTVRDTVRQVATSLGRHGIRILAVANAHLDPVHVGALRAVADQNEPGAARVVFLDLTRRRVAERLTEEFRSGACHAGRFEGSIVLAEAPELVRMEIAAHLEAVPASLSDAIRAGKRSFEEAGGDRAYFGWPAEATAEEGRSSLETLGALLAALVLESTG
jgi:creatinine amidohydrolase